MTRKRRDGREPTREKERLKAVVVMCKEKIKELPRAERGKAWRKCLEEYLGR